MLDGHIENPAALLGLVFCVVVTAAVMWKTRAGLLASPTGPDGEPRRLDIYGGLILAAIWLILAPLNLANKLMGGALVLIFGAEGMDTGLVEYLTVAQWAACVVLFALLARRERGLLRVVAALGAVAAFWCLGEEISWGQWLFHWASPDYFQRENLQGETNLHNFLTPVFYDWAYRIAGLGILAAALVLRFTRTFDRLPLVDQAAHWLKASRWGLPLALTAAAFMQHPALQELSEVALTAMLVHALAYTWTRPLKSR